MAWASLRQLLQVAWRTLVLLVVLRLFQALVGPVLAPFILGIVLVLLLLAHGLLPHLAAAHLRSTHFCAAPPSTQTTVRSLAEPLNIDVLVRLDVSEPLNAAYVATGKHEGILVLGSGLVGDDLRAATAHELGHAVARDSERNQGARALELLAFYGLLVVSLQLSIPLALLALACGVTAVRAVAASRRRVRELEADTFAASLVGPDPLAALLAKLEAHGYGHGHDGFMGNLLATHPFAHHRRQHVFAHLHSFVNRSGPRT